MTLATITFQNYFRLYDKLAGMTGTAMTEAEEFHKIYKLEVVAVPTHRPMVRDDFADLVYRNEQGKFNAILDEIVELQEQGRPVLVGTVSVEKSEHLGELLKRRGIKHEVLNAKLHEREAGVIAQAGRTGAVTISTNMAGRGTDILLGGNPAGMASESLRRRGLNPAEVDSDTYDAALAEAKALCAEDHERVVAAGGLHIIGTERHESRRIDNQLRGRAGRQGDPGSSRFYLSLDDDLMKRFASDRVAGMMERFGLEEDVPIESRIVSKTIESAQGRVEGFNFDLRKRVVEFDDVINQQRETIYAERDKVLHNEDLSGTVHRFLDEEVDDLIERFAGTETQDDWNLEGLAAALKAMGIEGEGATEDELWEVGGREALTEHIRGPGRSDLRREGRTGRRGRLGDRRAARAPAHDRLPVGRAPDRARRHAARHRPARLCPAGPAERVPQGSLLALHGTAGADPPPGGSDDLPRPGHARGAAACVPDADGRADLGGRSCRERFGNRRRCAGRWRGAPRRRRPGSGPVRSRAAARLPERPRRASRAASPVLVACRPAPTVRGVRESLGDQTVSAGRSAGAARVHADGRAHRPQRPVLVRLGREVQEVPRSVRLR